MLDQRHVDMVPPRGLRQHGDHLGERRVGALLGAVRGVAAGDDDDPAASGGFHRRQHRMRQPQPAQAVIGRQAAGLCVVLRRLVAADQHVDPPPHLADPLEVLLGLLEIRGVEPPIAERHTGAAGTVGQVLVDRRCRPAGDDPLAGLGEGERDRRSDRGRRVGDHDDPSAGLHGRTGDALGALASRRWILNSDGCRRRVATGWMRSAVRSRRVSATSGIGELSEADSW